MTSIHEFGVGDKVVYPSHGVGEITAVEVQSVGDMDLQVYAISFPHDKMTLRVPVKRATISGLRHLADPNQLTKAYSVLQGKAKIGNKMWSRRAQEYEAKINSGDIKALAEVIRDLHKEIDTDRSYSERTIYESAVNRLASEIAILENLTHTDAIQKLYQTLKLKKAA